jgi:phosphate:Na+ symporter
MHISILEILQVIGALSLFVYGMKVMSDGIQKVSGGRLRATLRNLTRNPTQGVVIGGVTTGLLQSSSATTVMVVSLVNAGLITVYQSVGLIMGANIGTTVTAWIVSLGGFLLKLSLLTLPILAIAVPVYFRSKKNYQYWAEVLIGFSLLFIGLDFLKLSLPSLQNEVVYDYIKNFISYGILSNFLFVFIGVVITLLVQSSSASMALTLAMAYNGWLPMDLAAYMIIGENIGTCFTAEVAALVGNINARRSARVHTLFNILGSFWIFFLLPVVLNSLNGLFSYFTEIENPFEDKSLMIIGLAAFHTSFNVLNTLLFLPLIKYLIGLSEWTLPLKINPKSSHRPNFLDPALKMSELSPLEIQLEISNQSKAIKNLLDLAEAQLKALNFEEQEINHQAIRRGIIKIKEDKIKIDEHVVSLASSGVSKDIYNDISNYLTISYNLNRMAKLISNLSLQLRDKAINKTWLTPKQRTLIFQMLDRITMAYFEMSNHLNKKDYRHAIISDSQEIEININMLRDEAREMSVRDKDEFDFNLEGTLMFMKLITIMENIGDRIFEVSCSVNGS